MTNKKMLKKLIELARENGCLSPLNHGTMDAIVDWADSITDGPYAANMMSMLLFHHEFAKAVFGEDFVWVNLADGPMRPTEKTTPKEIWVEVGIKWRQPRWRQLLQQLVLQPEPDRIKYAYDHRRQGSNET